MDDRMVDDENSWKINVDYDDKRLLNPSKEHLPSSSILLLLNRFSRSIVKPKSLFTTFMS